jgi:hypothetical protein
VELADGTTQELVIALPVIGEDVLKVKNDAVIFL